MTTEEAESAEVTTPADSHHNDKENEADEALSNEGVEIQLETQEKEPAEKNGVGEQEKQKDEGDKEEKDSPSNVAVTNKNAAADTNGTSSTDFSTKNTAEESKADILTHKEKKAAKVAAALGPPPLPFSPSPASPKSRVRLLSHKLWPDDKNLASVTKAANSDDGDEDVLKTPTTSTKRVIDIPTPTPIPSTCINEDGSISKNPQSVIELRMALASAQTKIDEQHLVMLRISEERYRITTQLTTLHEDYEKLEVNHSEWKKMYKDLENRSKQEDTYSRRLEEENGSLKMQVEILKATLEESEAFYEKEKTKNKLLESKMEKMEGQFQALLEKNQSVTMEKASLQDKLNETQSSLKKSVRENNIVRDKRMKLESKVSELERSKAELKKGMKELVAYQEEQRKQQESPTTPQKQKSKRAFFLSRALGSSRHGESKSKHGTPAEKTTTDHRSSWHGIGHKQRREKNDSKHGKSNSKHGYSLRSPRGNQKSTSKSREEMERLVNRATAPPLTASPVPTKVPSLAKQESKKKKKSGSQVDSNEVSSNDPVNDANLNRPPPSGVKKKKKSVKRLVKATMGQNAYSSAANQALGGTPPPSEAEQTSDIGRSSKKEGHTSVNERAMEEDHDGDASMLVCRPYEDDAELLANLGVEEGGHIGTNTRT